MLTSRLLYPPDVNPDLPTSKPVAAETRFLWKPAIHDFPEDGSGFFRFLTQAGETGFRNPAQTRPPSPPPHALGRQTIHL